MDGRSPGSSGTESRRPGPRPEVDLLLCCARIRLDAKRAGRVLALIGHGIDWELLLRSAGLHGMTPLLHKHLQALDPEGVPPAVLDRLRAHVADNTRRNLFLTGELLKTLAIARSRGISLIAYKGPALTLMAYGHLGLREFSDLDILAHPEDVPRVAELLASLGYEPEVRLDSARGAVYRRLETTLPFRRRDPDLTIELHWKLTPAYIAFPRVAHGVWDDLAPVSVGGREIPTLSREALLLFLTVHGAKHYWGSLGWVCDVACLLENAESIDWGRVLRRSDAEHCRRMLFIGLALARDLIGVALPPEVSERMLSDPTALRLANTIRERFLVLHDLPVRQIDHGLFLLRSRERLGDQALCFLKLALWPNEGDLMAVRLPSFLTPLYHIIRPLRLSARFVPQLFRRIGGPPRQPGVTPPTGKARPA